MWCIKEEMGVLVADLVKAIQGRIKNKKNKKPKKSFFWWWEICVRGRESVCV